MPRGRPRKNPDQAVCSMPKTPKVRVRKEKTVEERQAQTQAAHEAWRKFNTPEELRSACEAYFADCDEKGLLYGEAGLSLWLDISLDTLRSWYDGRYAKDLQYEARRAYLRIQSQIESGVAYRDKVLATRAIFLMKQQRYGGYQDKIEAKQDVSVKVNMGADMDESDFA